ncbi:YdcF family protein [Motiliproteus sp. MSK22-1]|uniref:YdcF family protein n=1 Tax=Motiliproteus sp. MSK22-1 TaxID=1897630 RepID=UPI0013011A70|nr:YdcF family protein [Motiliproteus sp. MSK22-1]
MKRVLSSDGDRRARPGGRKLLWLSLCLCWIIAAYPVGNILIYPLEKQYTRLQPPLQSELAGVIVLGGAERVWFSSQWDELEVNESGERIIGMLALLRQYPDLPFIYSSGSGLVTNQQLKGADIIAQFLKPLGLHDRVVYERESRNTYENAVFSAKLIGEQQTRPWLLVTSAFHMPRSVGVFQRQGINVKAFPVDHRSIPPERQGIHFDLAGNLSGLKLALREWIGLFAYWLTGKTVSFFPSELLQATTPESSNKASHNGWQKIPPVNTTDDPLMGVTDE